MVPLFAVRADSCRSHSGQRCAAHAHTAPLIKNPLVPRQISKDAHVPPGLPLYDTILLKSPFRR
eukprot:6913944-Pyramimonas_sp.AAC.1